MVETSRCSVSVSYTTYLRDKSVKAHEMQDKTTDL